jgi:hypothetical protein
LPSAALARSCKRANALYGRPATTNHRAFLRRRAAAKPPASAHAPSVLAGSGEAPEAAAHPHFVRPPPLEEATSGGTTNAVPASFTQKYPTQ